MAWLDIRVNSIEISIPSWNWNSPYRINWCKRNIRLWRAAFWFISDKDWKNTVLLNSFSIWFNHLNFVAPSPMFKNTSHTCCCFFGTGCCLLYVTQLLYWCTVTLQRFRWNNYTDHTQFTNPVKILASRKAWHITLAMCTYHILGKWDSTLP